MMATLTTAISPQGPYVGRFAPSPSGALHFGSLVAALGSYLRARSLGGKWLIRIEDIDPPREVKGAADDILRTLEAYGFEWDDTVLYQSARTDAYQAKLDQLLAQDDAYFCQCSRKQIQAMGGIYDGRCHQLATPHQSGAIRLVNRAQVAEFTDNLMGKVVVDHDFATEDFIIKRSDGLYAYQLAVVLDDAHQGISEVVRGCDLIEASCRQLSLYQSLGLTAPQWLHLPLACLTPGFKLSKQNHAQAIDKQHPQASLNAALTFLGQSTVEPTSAAQMLAQAVAQFELTAVPKQREIILTA
ncbi:glutamyl-Q-tRNA-Asp synthetase YadB [Shewanella oneidensis MR-1]|uniref:Glutamyl-Q tRNA(Asp) synthetase n=2 Tax=Shewanella oneidensis TaxID=70863 RepID=GLUQ_SHEON|nr:RecName: Full=Glutamyl-Q tRNA(Asp) synthetase; Short=Glu-Q-RSs [Shewanella oneidensis MR-1]AAN53949.1 glutamyl-Q-tRNA-Asp synthetase YadB [Shewanella oneidensis MR-1]